MFEQGTCIHAEKLAFEGKELRMVHIADVLEALTFRLAPDLVVCEEIWSTPGDGHVGAFTFGMGYGHIKGFCEGRGWRLKTIRPVTWKKKVLKGAMGMVPHAIKRIQAVYPKYNPKKQDKNKATTIDYVMNQHPQIELCPGRCRLPQDGIADAVCLAEYGATYE